MKILIFVFNTYQILSNGFCLHGTDRITCKHKEETVDNCFIPFCAMVINYLKAHTGKFLFVCLFVFVALRPMSTAMVIAGWSVHLTTPFPGQAWASG